MLFTLQYQFYCYLHRLKRIKRHLWIVELERYDHHQRGFTEVFGHGKQYQDSADNLVPHTTWLLRPYPCHTGFVTKLSSAGLVYKHYGKEIVAAAMGQPRDSPAVETTWLAVYKYFMEAVDGIDNGEPKMYMHQLNCAHMFVHSVKHRHIVQSSSTRWTAQTTAHAHVLGNPP